MVCMLHAPCQRRRAEPPCSSHTTLFAHKSSVLSAVERTGSPRAGQAEELGARGQPGAGRGGRGGSGGGGGLAAGRCLRDDTPLSAAPPRRWNPLTGEWLLVSPQRTARPWQGQVETAPAEQRPAYDPTCYLCPANARAGGVRNPDYTGTFVFENDFAALRPDTVP